MTLKPDPLTHVIDRVIHTHSVGYSLEVFPPKTPEALIKLHRVLLHIYQTMSNHPTLIY